MKKLSLIAILLCGSLLIIGCRRYEVLTVVSPVKNKKEQKRPASKLPQKRSEDQSERHELPGDDQEEQGNQDSWWHNSSLNPMAWWRWLNEN